MTEKTLVAVDGKLVIFWEDEDGLPHIEFVPPPPPAPKPEAPR